MMPAMMEYVPSFIAILLNIAGNCQGDFEITILHTNDCHARFAEINKYGGNCNQEDSQGRMRESPGGEGLDGTLDIQSASFDNIFLSIRYV